MVKVITYGTFDLFHKGHYNLLRRAKALGDYLIVAITSNAFDRARGKLNVHDSLVTRIKNVEKCGFADEIIVEEYLGQKIDDIKKYNIDIFTVGSDWIGHFDYLNEYCKVVYLERTAGISSSDIREKNSLQLGIIGNEAIVNRFCDEAKFVSGIDIAGIYLCGESNKKLLKRNGLREFKSTSELFKGCEAVYVALPPTLHFKYIKLALNQGKHVLCEFPFEINLKNAQELIALAKKKRLILMEGLKTAYCPAFTKLIPMARSGIIGNILAVDARFTQILADKVPEQVKTASGGSVNALASYPLLAIFKLLGTSYTNVRFVTKLNKDAVDIYTQISLIFPTAIANATVAIDAKSEGCLIITGTKGYIYVPAPWWKTNYFEVRYEDINKNTKYFYKFDGEGLRYEISLFEENIHNGMQSNLLSFKEMQATTKVIDKFNSKKHLIII